MNYLNLFERSFEKVRTPSIAALFLNKKAEKVIFSRIGYEMDKVLESDQKYLVSPEYPYLDNANADLVILEKGYRIKAIFEGKFYYTFDIELDLWEKGKTAYSSLLEDIERLSRAKSYSATRDSAKYFCLLMAHLPKDIKTDLPHNYKEANRNAWHKWLKEDISSDEIIERARSYCRKTIFEEILNLEVVFIPKDISKAFFRIWDQEVGLFAALGEIPN